MQASQERVSCVNVHVCLYVTYNTPISLCTAQLSLKQTPLRIFTFTSTRLINQGSPVKDPFARVDRPRFSQKRRLELNNTPRACNAALSRSRSSPIPYDPGVGSARSA